VPAINFNGPFQQAALAQHFGQNISALQNSFPQNATTTNVTNGLTNNVASPVDANPAPSAPQTNNAPTAPAPAPEPATAST